MWIWLVAGYACNYIWNLSFFNIRDYTYPAEGIQALIGNYVYSHDTQGYGTSYPHANVTRGPDMDSKVMHMYMHI
jgi:hypothetical protein